MVTLLLFSNAIDVYKRQVYSIREKVAQTVHAGGTQHMYRITLIGERDPRLRPDIREYMKCGRIFEVVDTTVPAFHLEELAERYRGQLIGKYIESFGDGQRSIVEEKALRYGLEALLYPKQ